MDIIAVQIRCDACVNKPLSPEVKLRLGGVSTVPATWVIEDLFVASVEMRTILLGSVKTPVSNALVKILT